MLLCNRIGNAAAPEARDRHAQRGFGEIGKERSVLQCGGPSGPLITIA
jgi:hypothetical protein